MATLIIDATRQGMTVQDTLGDRLTQAMKRAGLKNPEVAKAVGVHETTVSRWRNDGQAPDEPELVKLVEFLRERGLPWVSVAWLRYGGPRSGERLGVSESASKGYGNPEVEFEDAAIAQERNVWLNRFLAELAEQGGDSDFLNWARRFLTSPDNYALYVGGTRDEMRDDQKLRHMKGLAEGVRAILKERLKKGRGK